MGLIDRFRPPRVLTVATVFATSVVLALLAPSADAASRADLTSSRPVITPASVTVGNSAVAKSTVRNSGKRSAPASVTVFKLSLDKMINRGDVLAGGFATKKLQPGKSSTGKFSFQVPKDFPVGNYWLISCADGQKGVRESKEKNNCAAARISIVAAPAPPPPVDSDSDGVLDTSDNCPTQSNTNQLDGDSDLKGDACDPCPSAANPGTQGCPATVYQVKNLTLSAGYPVRIEKLVVTAVHGTKAWAQHPSSTPGFDGVEHSGIVLNFTGTPPVAEGHEVTVDGTIDHAVVGSPRIAVTSSVVTTPVGPPVAVTQVTASQLGAQIDEYDAVLIKIVNSTSVGTYGSGWLLQDAAQFAVFPTIVGPLGAPGAGYSSVIGFGGWDGLVYGITPRRVSEITPST